MVNVRSIAEMGAYVSLLEYNNIEGMILLSELSRRRIRSINKLIRIGRNECVVVIRVDKEKDIEVACYGYEGIDAVKEALRAGLNCSTETMPIKINLIAPPRYVMTTTTLERTEGLSVLNQAMAVIKEKIEEKRGVFNVQMEPKVVTDTDETELARQLERLERENAEVDGDDDAEEMEAKAED